MATNRVVTHFTLLFYFFCFAFVQTKYVRAGYRPRCIRWEQKKSNNAYRKSFTLTRQSMWSK